MLNYLQICENIKSELVLSKLFSVHLHISPIVGGALNQSFCLKDGSKQYFVKVFTSDSMAHIDRLGQFSQQAYLAAIGVAAKPCYLALDHSFQVDSWVDGQSLRQADVNTFQPLSLLAKTLAGIHCIENKQELNLSTIHLAKKWQDYLDISQIRLSNIEQKNMQVMAEFWEQDSPYCCVCHNDLSLEHVVVEPSGIVFDWEYAGYSSPFFDIASTIIINHISDESEKVLLSEYAHFSEFELAFVQEKVATMKPLVEFTNYLWFAAAQKQGE